MGAFERQYVLAAVVAQLHDVQGLSRGGIMPAIVANARERRPSSSGRRRTLYEVAAIRTQPITRKGDGNE
jgi:hypothetical protein